MIVLKNEFLTVKVLTKGAELTSIINNLTQQEYLWQGDATFWGRQAPILFPFVGKSIDNQYQYQAQTYPMNQHGFARDQEFEVISQSQTSVTLQIADTKETRLVYPFAFVLQVTYQLKNNQIQVGYQVNNPSATDDLYFSIGGHPGFNIPLAEKTKFEDYYLDFQPQKSRVKIPLDGAYLDLDKRTLAPTDVAIDLSRDLFENDALIYELQGQKNTFWLKSDKTSHAVGLTLENAPFIGVWSPYPADAPFVCLEPWWGIADQKHATGQLVDKFGVNQLQAQQEFKASYQITIQ